MSISDKFFSVTNKKYSGVDIKGIATSFFKKVVEPGEAVVNIFGSFGIAGFKFHIPENEQVNLESDITDYYTDSNSVLQDHIARKPIRVTSAGLIGEYFYSINEIEDALAKVAPTMSLVKQFLPRFNKEEMSQIVKRETRMDSNPIKSVAGKGIAATLQGGVSKTQRTTTFNGLNLLHLFTDLYKIKSAQTRAYFFFEAMWKSQAPFSVETR